jgi:hypothetical protein
MRLIDPGVGEVTDRLTILSLKLLFGAETGRDLAHFQKEQSALLAKIRTRDLNGAWFHSLLELAAVNAALWHREDDLRALRSEGQTLQNVDAIVECAFRIQELNDRRAVLIAAINKEAGDGGGEEKVHGER